MKFKDMISRFFSFKWNDRIQAKKELKAKGNWECNVSGTKSKSQHAKEFLNVYNLKYKIIYPLMWFIDKFKYMKVKSTKDACNTNLNILQNSIEEGMFECFNYYSGFEGKMLDNGSYKLVDSIKEWIVTLAMKDQWIKELLNFIIFRIALNINREYKNNQQHLIYSSSYINDVEYWKIVEQMKVQRSLVKVK